MKTAIYPGSFNPWHEGHQDVLDKALMVFDRVIIAQGLNPEKSAPIPLESIIFDTTNIICVTYTGLLINLIDERPEKIDAVIKGLRNPMDFEYEKNQQYWNEDLGIDIPTFYVISDRKTAHFSSSAIKMVKKYE